MGVEGEVGAEGEGGRVRGEGGRKSLVGSSSVSYSTSSFDKFPWKFTCRIMRK